MTDDICGSTDTTTGEPCQRPAGWGTDGSDVCRDHEREFPRPRKLTPQREQGIVDALENGVPVRHAAPANGIDKSTYYEWVRLGEEQEEGLLSDFSDRVTRAKDRGQGSILEDAVTFAREQEDSRALLKAYAEIVGGANAHGDDGDALEWFESHSDVVRYTPETE